MFYSMPDLATLSYVTVDDHPFDASAIGVGTIGQLIDHVSQLRRLITSILIDGQSPDLDELEFVRRTPLAGRVVFMQTADHDVIAKQVLEQLDQIVDLADQFRTQAAQHLVSGGYGEALKKLGVCFGHWSTTQESIGKVARLLRIDLEQIMLSEQSLDTFLKQFAQQLNDVKTAIESRDYVQLSDTLNYEMNHAGESWKSAIQAMKREIH